MPAGVDRSVGLKNVVVAASQTDSVLVAATPGKRVRVLALSVQAISTSTFVFNSKGSGAGTVLGFTAITPTAGQLFNWNTSHGLFETNASEGLTTTTGAGGNTNFIMSYVII